ncbi:MAG TPA: phosphopantetheine-binding protein [Bacteroidales bacterium]|nr:phosphopantetheine-binding protein [Bacteroidales bacterium]
MQQEEIIKKINQLLIEEIEIDDSQISPGASLKDDLGIDSLDFVDLFVIIEHHFGFKMKAEDMSGVITLEDFYNFIIRRVNPN